MGAMREMWNRFQITGTADGSQRSLFRKGQTFPDGTELLWFEREYLRSRGLDLIIMHEFDVPGSEPVTLLCWEEAKRFAAAFWAGWDARKALCTPDGGSP